MACQNFYLMSLFVTKFNFHLSWNKLIEHCQLYFAGWHDEENFQDVRFLQDSPPPKKRSYCKWNIE